MHLRTTITAIIIVGILFTAAAQGGDTPPIVKKIQDYYGQIKDVKLTAETGKTDFDELKKINEDFAMSWRVSRVKVEYKGPDMLRVEGKVGPITVTTITNGDIKYTKAPLKGESREDIKDFPNKKQSGLDFGILPGVVWTDHHVKQLPDTKIGAIPVYVLELTPKADPKWGVRKLYIAIADLKLLRYEKYNEHGGLKLQNNYSNYKKFANVWIPQRVEVRNQFLKFGGEMLMSDIKVNTSIPDSRFDTS